MKALMVIVRIISCFGFAVALLMFFLKDAEAGIPLLLMSLLLFFASRAGAKKTARQVEPGSLTEVGDDRLRVTLDKWVVLDVETTGLDPKNDRIIEIAARKFMNGFAVDSFESLVNPGRPLPRKITELTGIRNMDLLSAPRFHEIAPALAAFLGNNIMVAHNAKFDAEFVVTELARAGITLDISYINTVRMARWCFPGLENYKLNTLIMALGLQDHEQDHRAMSDVDATEKLYMMCREEKAEFFDIT